MASTIKVNNLQNQCGANIVNKCSTTITLGASGDNIVLASGATQSGFGRTGTVDWDTTAKTAGFTAVSGTGYFVNTTSGAVTVTLPATPSSGDIVSVSDYNGTAETNAIIIARNGSNINGDASDYAITRADSAVTFVYVDGTVGWTSIQTSNISDNQNPFIVATGGTETTCGDYKIHTFTGPGTFTVSSAGNATGSNTVDYLVVAGGGGGSTSAGGGGAGGYRESSGAASGCYTVSPLGACVSALPLSITSYPITVGAGGTGATFPPSTTITRTGSKGSNSVFNTITSTGGGGGIAYNTPRSLPCISAQVTGGSGGGGGAGGGDPIGFAGGAGNNPPVSPSQGNPGGTGGSDFGPAYPGGGGGGATAAGGNGATGNPTSGPSGPGGAGATSSINGTPTARAGGGGGAGWCSSAGGSASAGGGAGATGNASGTSGTANTGGGGGSGGTDDQGTFKGQGGAGGSGIVIIRYKYQ